mgnify:FL=1|jgi:hypothetical protein
MTTTIEQIEQHAANIRDGLAKIQPGESHTISDAASTNDGYPQGDLSIILVDAIPDRYKRIERPTDKDRQLVPGNTEGSRHCLDSLDGVELYRHEEWNQDYDGLMGPAVRLTKERTITHPKHGDITIPDGRIVLTTYQPDYDAETRKTRRNAD